MDSIKILFYILFNIELKYNYITLKFPYLVFYNTRININIYIIIY